MTRMVHKFPVPLGDLVRCDVRVGGFVVHVGSQANTPTLWIEVDPAASDETRIFHVFATGQPIPKGWLYVGTAQNDAGSPFVWHVYELRGTP